jgi:hypothetical protein
MAEHGGHCVVKVLYVAGSKSQRGESQKEGFTAILAPSCGRRSLGI